MAQHLSLAHADHLRGLPLTRMYRLNAGAIYLRQICRAVNAKAEYDGLKGVQRDADGKRGRNRLKTAG